MNSAAKLIGLEIQGDLADLWLRKPDGITIIDLQKHTSLPYHSVHAAAIWLVERGKAKWTRRPDRQALLLVPNDWEEPVWDLTEKQNRVLQAIVSRAENNKSTMSFKDIVTAAGISSGSISAHIDALERKGYLHTDQPGSGTTKSQFTVYPEGDGPQGYSKARFQQRQKPG